MNATAERPAQLSSGSIRWIRVVVAAVLLEFALVVVLVPIGVIFGEPFIPGGNETYDYTVFFTAVPVACFVFGYIAGRIVVRKVEAHFTTHGVLVGVVATALYLLMSSFQPGGLPVVIAGYGVIHFWGTQVLRMVGCTLGGSAHGKASA